MKMSLRFTAGALLALTMQAVIVNVLLKSAKFSDGAAEYTRRCPAFLVARHPFCTAVGCWRMTSDSSTTG